MLLIGALLLSLACCGSSWQPSNVAQIQSDVWHSITTEPEYWDYWRPYFLPLSQARAYCEGHASCYWAETGKAYIANDSPELCGTALALELGHYVLHVTLGNPDKYHSLIPLWEKSGLFDGYACESP